MIAITGRIVGKMDFSPRCRECKCKMVLQDTKAPLFLIPVWTDHKYAASEQFFIDKMVPIQVIDQIPSGQRACWIWSYRCPQCNVQKVKVEDFLYSRGVQIGQEEYVYDYDIFVKILGKCN